jgi:hypothetical protein
MEVAMNPELSADGPVARWETFSAAYREGLRAAVAANPRDFLLDGHSQEEFVERVSARMLLGISEHPMGVHYASDGFRRTCKALGIKHTRKAILAYLRGQ